MITQEEHNEQVYKTCMQSIRAETLELGAPRPETIQSMCQAGWYAFHQYYPETERIIASVAKTVTEGSLVSLEVEKPLTGDLYVKKPGPTPYVLRRDATIHRNPLYSYTIYLNGRLLLRRNTNGKYVACMIRNVNGALTTPHWFTRYSGMARTFKIQKDKFGSNSGDYGIAYLNVDPHFTDFIRKECGALLPKPGYIGCGHLSGAPDEDVVQ